MFLASLSSPKTILFPVLDTNLSTSSSSLLPPSFQRRITRSEDASRKVSEILEYCKCGGQFQHPLFCASQNQLPPSLVWNLLNSFCSQAGRAGCTVLLLPESLLLTFNFPTTSFPQVQRGGMSVCTHNSPWQCPWHKPLLQLA